MQRVQWGSPNGFGPLEFFSISKYIIACLQHQIMFVDVIVCVPLPLGPPVLYIVSYWLTPNVESTVTVAYGRVITWLLVDKCEQQSVGPSITCG